VTVVGRLLQSCPAVRVLATSREPLGAAGETTYRVPSLGLPAGETDADCESVMLFADRAALARPTMKVGPAGVAAMTAICTRLDGIPLAIELAAARCGALAPAQIASRLEGHFGLLTGGAAGPWPASRPSTPPSTGATPCSPTRSVSCCGGCRLSPVASRWRRPSGRRRRAARGLEVTERLTGLIEKSLVQEEVRAGEPRYRLLETIRQYAARELSKAGEAEAVRRRHAEYVVEFAETAEDGLYGPDLAAWSAALEADVDNIRAADDWAVEQDEAELALRLAAALRVFWQQHPSEGSRRSERAWASRAVRRRRDCGRRRPATSARSSSMAHRPTHWSGGRSTPPARTPIRRPGERPW